MSTSTTTSPTSAGTDANFRASAVAIDNQFTALGWVRTADTGQINFVTVAHPTLGNYAGYSVFRMADTLQATAPVFAKIEYGSTGSANAITFRITVGQATDGAGAITGVQAAPFVISTSVDYTIANANSYFSGDTNRFVMVAYYDGGSNGNGLLFSIERSKDATGADTGEAVLIAYGAVGNAISTTVLVVGQGEATSQTGTATAAVPQSGTNFTFGTNVGLSGPNYYAGKRFPDGMNLLAYLFNDFSAGITATVVVYGTNHTYRFIHDHGPTINNNSNNRLAMRYE